MSVTRTIRPRSRAVAVAAAVCTAATATVAVATQAVGATALAAPCAVLFDDFAYTSSADANLTARGWVPRGYAGGPGVPGATWSASSVTFPTVNGNKVAQLTSSTDGTAAGTRQSELYTSQQRFFEGTYASRILRPGFGLRARDGTPDRILGVVDAPTSGPDGDHIVQTFSPSRR